MASCAEVSDRYVDRWAALDPTAATAHGITGFDDRMTDYSPAAVETRIALDRSTLADLGVATATGDRDRIAGRALADWLANRIALAEAGEPWRELRPIDSPLQKIRGCFDLMARETPADWDAIAARLAAVPEAVAGYLASLRAGRDRGLTAARRQAIAVADQAAVWSGSTGGRSFFVGLVDDFAGREFATGSRRDGLVVAADQAAAAYASAARFLREEYAPRVPDRDPVGPERYALAARVFTGADLDLAETSAWGWDDLHRIEAEMAVTADRIVPGAGLDAVTELLETDPDRSIEGVDRFRQWMQDLQDSTIAALDGEHFDIPEPVRLIEAMIAPPGGALAQYYTGPSEDFSRPGRTWCPTAGRTRFPLWSEVSTAYHEGVPGHHLQIGQVTYLAGELTRFQRLLGWLSGHGEGWALYAERLMAELGYLDNPDYYLGYLRSRAMRAARVIVDIGLHLELPIPPTESFHPGATWTPALALTFLVERARLPADFAASELDRYLGWPGQAISYKVGERTWLQIRASIKQRQGSAFDLKAFHARALALGPLGLDCLTEELLAG